VGRAAGRGKGNFSWAPSVRGSKAAAQLPYEEVYGHLLYICSWQK